MAESGVMDVLALSLFGAFGLLLTLWCVISGVAAMNGTWRTWAAGWDVYKFGKHSYFGFLGIYLLPVIAWGILLAVSTELDAGWLDGINSDYILVALMVPPLACFFRLPRFMLPRWYKDWLDRGANEDEVRKDEYSSPFTWLKRRKDVHG